MKAVDQIPTRVVRRVKSQVRDEDPLGAMRTTAPARSVRQRWQARLGSRLLLTDVAVVLGAVGLAQFARFGAISDADLSRIGTSRSVSYTIVSALFAALWLGFLSLQNSRSARVVGGIEEYRRIVSATLQMFGLIAIVSLIAKVDIARGYLAVALPVGLAGLLLGRGLWRRHAVEQRTNGAYQAPVLVVGGESAARAMAAAFARDRRAGYRVVGLCTPAGAVDGEEHMDIAGDQVPIVGTDTSILAAIEQTGADTVAVTATDYLNPSRIRQLVWDLESLGVDLIVTPGVEDVALQRLASRPVDGTPMLHLEKPQYSRATSFSKTAFDFCFAVAALIAVAPVMLVAAIAVKLGSRGPIFYRSERIGLDGKPFKMIKFRSMYEDADRHLSALLNQNEGAGPLFKMRTDPRITPVGRILRRYSLDELPQFLNVVRGEMSVVGPRPPLRREVEAYSGLVRRRMLVKPGLTGLWQISGRSDLDWDESVRLDLSYVENWSMLQDLVIIKKTLGAVTRPAGAY